MRLPPPGRKTLIGLAILAFLVVAGGLVLDPLATHLTRKELARGEHFTGHFRDVELTLLPFTYTLEGLTLYSRPVQEDEEPYLRLERLVADISWSQLVRGHLVMDVFLDHPKLTVVGGKKTEKIAKKQAEEAAERPEEQRSKFRVDELRVRNGEVLHVDSRLPGNPELWVHRVNATVTHYSPSGPPDSKTTVRATGILQRSGRITVELDAYPLAKRPTFTGTAKVERQRLVELYELVAPSTGLSPVRGTLDVYILVDAKDGEVRGGVKPVVQNAEIEQAEPGLGTKLKEILADASLSLFDDEAGRVATLIPIRGSIKSPEAHLWPTVLGVLRNAFVEGVQRGFSDLPVPQAREEQNPFAQLRDALDRQRGVKAQPPQKRAN